MFEFASISRLRALGPLQDSSKNVRSLQNLVAYNSIIDCLFAILFLYLVICFVVDCDLFYKTSISLVVLLHFCANYLSM